MKIFCSISTAGHHLSITRQGQIWIREHNAVGDMFDRQNQIGLEQTAVHYFFNSIENILLNGTGLILDRVFRLIGYISLLRPHRFTLPDPSPFINCSTSETVTELKSP